MVFSFTSIHKGAFDCVRCPEIQCLSLFDHIEKYQNIGGEFYIYELLGTKMKEKYDELNKYVCRNGNLLRITCFLTHPIVQLKEKSYLKDVLNQSARDLKASMFLACSGHYRQAMQVLRCSFENLISGIYFHGDFCQLQKDNNATKKDYAILERRFNEWKRSGRANILGSIEILRRIGFLNRNDEKDWKDLYRHLSRFIHTPEEYVFHEKHETLLKDIEIACPSKTYYNEDSLRAWSDSFEKIFMAILKTIVTYHPFALKTQSGKIAITQLRSVEKKFGITDDTMKLLYDKLVLPNLS